MYYAYFRADGTPLSVSSKPSNYPEPDVMRFEVPDMTDGNKIYLDVSTYAVMEKQPFAVKLSYNRVSNLPAGTRISIDEGEFIIDDGSAEFDADIASLKVVWLDHPHYLATHVEVQTGPENA
jgi:hypothetical protein